MDLNAYISFRNTAREALEFYQSVLGGELTLNDFSAYPDMGVDPSETHLIMHGQLTTEDGMTLMASDSPTGMPYTAPAGISVSLSGDDAERLQRAWDGLSDGGTVVMPYEEPPWGGRFGMLTDRFGIDWMVALNA
ncbi:VOC family protein [Microbacterium saccharophilum]|uniref:VOC family protein n=1 Tax=Microbacterium saccharophilum TaxID=1213358 RepID=A0A5C8I0R4_9MICO|nr:VOC family protein [Microbacterium saccharophilum]TXK11269.1 VOC family protein [Microbacterium saccharophilum]GEP48618.1 VOC family protein [Microbacterium saccharophilum]